MVKRPVEERRDNSDVNNRSLYHPLKEKRWTGIRWSKVEKTVENLQHRITKATEHGKNRKMRNLQRLLKSSESGRMIAVRQVGQENSDKNTPGIDGEVWTTPGLKIQAIQEIKGRSKTKPLRRIYIPKTDGSKKPLGIPYMKDQAKQAVWGLALSPVVEATSDTTSFGFMPRRSCWDVNSQLRTILDKKSSPEWILDGDIEKCFDRMNHQWLLDNVPTKKSLLKSGLKAEYIENNKLIPTKEGTPQGGVISPILANAALNGLEQSLNAKFPQIKNYKETSDKQGETSNKWTQSRSKINLVRYADDLIITGKSERQLLRVKKHVNVFLEERGLQLNESKTSINHISEGFDFLGWNIKKYSHKLLIKISKKSITSHKKDLRCLVKNTSNPGLLITKLNALIRGWMNYHRCCNDIWSVWSELNHYLFNLLIKWARKRHGRKTRQWVFRRYWSRVNGKWSFSYSNPKDNKTYRLISYNYPQVRVVNRIRINTNVYDKRNKDYLNKLKSPLEGTLTSVKDPLWVRQRGVCPVCKKYMEKNMSHLISVHHIVPIKDVGSNAQSNLLLLHKHCHYESQHGTKPINQQS
jgi:RNA-directed DNA polymerase